MKKTTDLFLVLLLVIESTFAQILPSANCVYGGGSCSSGSSTPALKERTIILFAIHFAVALFFSILVICCFVKSCPWFGDCGSSRGQMKFRGNN